MLEKPEEVTPETTPTPAPGVKPEVKGDELDDIGVPLKNRIAELERKLEAERTEKEALLSARPVGTSSRSDEWDTKVDGIIKEMNYDPETVDRDAIKREIRFYDVIEKNRRNEHSNRAIRNEAEIERQFNQLDPEDRKEYESAIRGELKRLSPDAEIHPNFVNVLLYYCAGQKAKEKIRLEKEKARREAQENRQIVSQAGTEGGAPSGKSKKSGLSEAEKHWAKKTGLTEEEYEAAKNRPRTIIP